MPGEPHSRPFLVRDIMVTDVVTLKPDDTVEQAASRLLERGVGGAPVVDDEGRVLGLLSDSDLVVRHSHLHIPTIFTLFGEVGAGFSRPSLQALDIELRKALGSTVADVMDPYAATCGDEESIEDAATRMAETSASRLPVLREGRLVGVIARGDLVRLLVRTEPDAQP